MALGTIDTHSEWHHVRWSYPDSVLAHLLHLLCTLTHTPAPRPEHAIALTDDRLCHSVLAAARRSAAVPRGHATTSRRRQPASTAPCRQPSARLPTTSVTTSVWTQAPSRIRHRRVIPRHGWRSRGRAVPSAQHPVRARRWRQTASRLRPADRDMTRDSITVQNPLYGESGFPPASAPERCVRREKSVKPYFSH